MKIEEILKQMSLELPPVPSPAGAYVSVAEAERFAFMSGLLPRNGDQIVYRGRVGAEVTVSQAQEAARLCVLNAFSVLRGQWGDLDRLKRIVRMTGYVQTHSSFFDIPQVLNGASNFLKEVLGEKGIHARTAVGVSSLPGNAVCEIELTVEVR
ncbi:MAG TPA: RidA family protein [Candidatus Omnitrophota bacterium]|nr:RidA family protein [Candidatus Omnitrophota bacterium]